MDSLRAWKLEELIQHCQAIRICFLSSIRIGGTMCTMKNAGDCKLPIRASGAKNCGGIASLRRCLGMYVLEASTNTVGDTSRTKRAYLNVMVMPRRVRVNLVAESGSRKSSTQQQWNRRRNQLASPAHVISQFRVIHCQQSHGLP